MKKKKDKKPGKTIDIAAFIVMCVLIVQLVLMLLPYVWAFFTSFKDDLLDYRYNKLGFPNPWDFGNYERVFKKFVVEVSLDGNLYKFDFNALLINSVVYALSGAFMPVFTTYMVAYVRNRYDFSILKGLDVLVVMSMALPIYGTLASSIVVYKFFNLYNNFLGYVIIGRMGFLSMDYFIVGAIIKSIPKAFVEAAEIDGAGEMQIFFRVMLPLTVGVFLTIYFLGVISTWNDYQVPMIFLNNMPTLAYGIYRIKNTPQGGIDTFQHQIAACLILVIPILIAFIIFHDKIMKGVSLNAGIKE